MEKHNQEITVALFDAAQLTLEKAWPPSLFNVKMCAGSDKSRR